MATKTPSYKRTILACYVGNFVQASLINITPVLFVTLMTRYGLGFEKLGRLVLINFATQVLVDLVFSGIVDRRGIRPFIVASQALAVLGLGLFALAPRIFRDPYLGFVVATIVFSGSGGLLELLLSPIVNAIPTEGKAGAMSLLHSFYSWGQLTVIVVTTAFLLVAGGGAWPLIVLFWAIPPAANMLLFARAPLAPQVPEERRTRLGTLFRERGFLLCLAGIIAGGATEVTMAQWAPAFAEKALGIPKIVGDTAGLSLFAIAMGIGRATYGKLARRIDLGVVLPLGAAFALLCYLVAALSPWPILSLAACAACGIGVSLLWPGSIVVAAGRYPLAGASMFAIMAAGGDIGASLGPWLVGLLADLIPAALRAPAGLAPAEFGLRAGLLAAAAFPIAALAATRSLGRTAPRRQCPIP